MTLEEKQAVVRAYCRAHDCNNCMFDHEGTWCTTYNLINCPEEDLDKTIQQINDSMKVTQPETVSQHDPVSHPSHYTQGGMECIDEMILIFGAEPVKHFCLLNAWKYRKRAMFKNGQEDMDKSDWYINKYKELTDGTNIK